MLLVIIDILNQAFKIISSLNFDNGIAPYDYRLPI